ncbi:MAG: FAD-dependent oxidoreductase [Lautropia sp.]
MPLSLVRRAITPRRRLQRHIPGPTELARHYDVVIIGGGGHGLATAYQLATRHGITNVAVLEKGYLGGGNTARNTMAVRANYMTEASVAFYRASLRLFEQMSAELDFNIMFSQRGQLTLGHSDSALDAFRYRAELGRHMGLKIELLDRAAVRALVPALDLDPSPQLPVIGALWHPEAGMVRHDAVAWGYAFRASQRGVEIHQQTEVTGVTIESGRVTGVTTTRGPVACGAVVQAVAGASSVVARLAGLELPITTYPLQAIVTEPLKPLFDPMVSSAQLHTYLSQTPRGEIVIGGGSDPYPRYNTRSTFEMKRELVINSVRLFPCLSGVKIMRQWAGMTDMTPDYSPVMGESGIDAYYLDAGWGTWGFKATPICGVTMAELVATGRTPDLIKPFALDRFRSFALVNEMGATAASH